MQVKRNGRGVSRGGVRAFACAMTVTFVAVAPLGSAALAQVAVSSGGTPTYGVNIAVPPGIGGMAPNLGLAYTGGGVNGPVGYGWTLTGISLITRCAATIANDGAPGGVRYAPSDRLCLDGQRLIETNSTGVPVASSPAANGALLDANGVSAAGGYTEYRTQTDLYSRIRAYGMANGAAANGPLYFKVWTKAGQIYEYGSPPSSDPVNTNASISAPGNSAVSAWAVSRISDTVGNYIDFKYSHTDTAWGSGPNAGSPTSGHEWELAEIQYTGNAATGQLPNNKVVFEYESRPDTPGAAQDRSEAYHLGFKNVSVQRLKTVRTYVNWPGMGVAMPGGTPLPVPTTSAGAPTAAEVKALKLTYQQGPTSGRSRLVSTQECFGQDEATCLPATTVAYAPTSANETYTPNAAFAGGPLSTLQLENAAGTMGVLVGDFNGDGRTDIIRWSDTPSQNVLYTSNGDGTFTQQTAFNLTATNLFKSDGCYSSVAMDFNGDGLTDILRVAQPMNNANPSVACPTPIQNILYLSKGDGTFATVTLPSNIDLSQVVAWPRATPTCPGTQEVVRAQTASLARGAAAPATTCANPYKVYSSNQGANFHIIDVNGDGIPDIVTTITPEYDGLTTPPVPDSICAAGMVCTHVYLGSTTGNGTFTELTTTNLRTHTVYGTPSARYQPTRFRPYVIDMDGDGLSDLIVDSGVWRSLGNGNFTQVTTSPNGGCQYPMDFNGDGRVDCMTLQGPTGSNFLSLSDGSGNFPVVAGFNLSASGTLTPTTSPPPVGSAVGVVFADLDGDGRTDIIRWSDVPTQNQVYLSNGDGTFRLSGQFNLDTANFALKKSDGSLDFLTADFTGNGQTEILRTVSTINAGAGAGGTNQLFVKNSVVPSEELQSVTPPSGLTSTVTFIPITNAASALGPRYSSARVIGSPLPYPKMDVIMPLRVVETVETATGVGSTTLKDEYAYGGLRTALDGRGLLGFQTVSEQHTAPDGSQLVTSTTYLQDGAYQGLASVTQTMPAATGFIGPALPISRTTNSYCDTTSTATHTDIGAGGTANAPPTPPTPCATSSLVQRPYLYQSLEEGWDNTVSLPTVRTTNVFDGYGNVTQVSVSQTGNAGTGLAQTVTKTTANTYTNDVTTTDWILGRLTASTQTNTVPNSLSSITTSAGSATYAASTTGVAFNATWSVPSFANTAVGQSTTASATLTNTSSGALALTAPTASSVTGTDFSFVSTTCGASLAAGGTCAVTVGFAPTAATTRTGTLTVQTGVGAKSVNLTAQGLTPPALALTGCASTTPTTTPTAAHMTCTVGNTGQTAASGIAYASSLGGMTVAGGPSTCAANTSSCGSVTVTSPTAVGSYAGNVTATPSFGSGASAAFSLSVRSAVTMTLSGCASVTPATPSAVASMTCTVGNSGVSAASGLTYASSVGGMSISGGPTSCAANSSCGTVTIATGTTAGTFAGNLTVTPASGAAASAGFNLVETAAPVAFTSAFQQINGNNTRTGTWTFTNPNAYAVQVGTVTAVVNPASMAAAGDIAFSGTCQSATVGAGATCTVVLTTTADCTAFTATPTFTAAGVVSTGVGYVSQPKTTISGACN